jgi:hypothetical protein
VSALKAPPPRLALRKQEAVAALAVSGETFDRHVRPYVRVVRCGSLRVYPICELERFLESEASAAEGARMSAPAFTTLSPHHQPDPTVSL